MKKIIVLVVGVLCAGLVAAHAETESPVTFDMLKQGKDIFENNCIDCHELEWPLRKVTDRVGWEEILTKMANTGAILDPADRGLVLEYRSPSQRFRNNAFSVMALSVPWNRIRISRLGWRPCGGWWEKGPVC